MTEVYLRFIDLFHFIAMFHKIYHFENALYPISTKIWIEFCIVVQLAQFYLIPIVLYILFDLMLGIVIDASNRAGRIAVVFTRCHACTSRLPSPGERYSVYVKIRAVTREEVDQISSALLTLPPGRRRVITGTGFLFIPLHSPSGTRSVMQASFC